jgi:hypothetical protein
MPDRKKRTVPKVIVLGVLLLVLVVLMATLLFWNRIEWRLHFGTWSATKTPPRIELCGRTFLPDRKQEQTLAEVRAWATTIAQRNPQDKLSGIQVVDHTPAGTPILASTQVSPPVSAGGACTEVIFINVSPNRYVAYSLSGGP